MIKKIVRNVNEKGELNLEPTEKILEKLDYYRSLIPKLTKLTTEGISNLQNDILHTFNLTPFKPLKKIPEHLFRISINNRILEEEKLGFLTEISQILAPPLDKCDYNRCNLPRNPILYCSTDEMTAYWEAKPKKGDVITISLFKAKPNVALNCNVLDHNHKRQEVYNNQLQEVSDLLDDFFIEIYTMPVEKADSIKYLFSAALSSKQLSTKTIEAIVYPSVQRKMKGYNVALKNEKIFEKYDLISVNTRFIIDEKNNVHPHSDNRPIDDLIPSIQINNFDFEARKIVYPQYVLDKFNLFRGMQQADGKQIRFDKPVDANEFLKNLQNKSF